MKNSIKREDPYIQPISTWDDYGIKNIQQLKDWIFVKLGYPLINVELTDNQLNACIADGLALYSKYAYTPVKYLIVNTKFYKAGEGIDLSEFKIMSVKDISFQRDNLFGQGNDMFFGPYAFFGQGTGSPMFGLGGQSYVGTWTTYHNLHEWFDLTKRMMGSNPDWSYDKNTKILKLMPEPKYQGDHFILLTVNQTPPIEEYLGNDYCKSIILAYCKILLGTIRKKFSSISLVGGGSVDVSIGDEGKEELDKLKEDLIKSESVGQCCVIA